MPKRVILFYPVELDQPPVNWDEDLDIPIEYQPGLPTRPEFWKSIESGTLCVIDDLYDKDWVSHTTESNIHKPLINNISLHQRLLQVQQWPIYLKFIQKSVITLSLLQLKTILKTGNMHE